MVGQGGGNRLVNHHAAHPEQAWAADIVGVGPWGFRTTGPLPEDLEPLRHPPRRRGQSCGGRVVAVRDGLPDLRPQADPE